MGRGVPCKLPFRVTGHRLSVLPAARVSAPELLVVIGGGAVLPRVPDALPVGGGSPLPGLVAGPTRRQPRTDHRRLVRVVGASDRVEPDRGVLLALDPGLGTGSGWFDRGRDDGALTGSGPRGGGHDLAWPRRHRGSRALLQRSNGVSRFTGGDPGRRRRSRHRRRRGRAAPRGRNRSWNDSVWLDGQVVLFALPVALAHLDHRRRVAGEDQPASSPEPRVGGNRTGGISHHVQGGRGPHPTCQVPDAPPMGEHRTGSRVDLAHAHGGNGVAE